jgi:hypothetical protein
MGRATITQKGGTSNQIATQTTVLGLAPTLSLRSRARYTTWTYPVPRRQRANSPGRRPARSLAPGAGRMPALPVTSPAIIDDPREFRHLEDKLKPANLSGFRVANFQRHRNAVTTVCALWRQPQSHIQGVSTRQGVRKDFIVMPMMLSFASFDTKM